MNQDAHRWHEQPHGQSSVKSMVLSTWLVCGKNPDHSSPRSVLLIQFSEKQIGKELNNSIYLRSFIDQLCASDSCFRRYNRIYEYKMCTRKQIHFCVLFSIVNFSKSRNLFSYSQKLIGKMRSSMNNSPETKIQQKEERK